MIYSALDAIIGAKVTEANEHYIVFDNGIRFECEDLENYFNVSGYKGAE
jgi:hypothetical protein